MSTVAELLERGANSDTRMSDLIIPLHIAVRRENIAIAKLLIQKNPQLNVDAQTVDGTTTLHTATRNGDTRLTQLLLDHGAKYLPDNSTAYSCSW